MKHECIACCGNGHKIEIDQYGDVYIYNEKCESCKGNGELEECQCCAYEPSECVCGAWDDIDLNEWYNLEEE